MYPPETGLRHLPRTPAGSGRPGIVRFPLFDRDIFLFRNPQPALPSFREGERQNTVVVSGLDVLFLYAVTHIEASAALPRISFTADISALLPLLSSPALRCPCWPK